METLRSVSQRFVFFSQNTSFHGFREMTESRRRFQKLIWISIMIGSVAMLAYSLQKQVNRYLSDPMMTRITQLSEGEPYKYPEVWFQLADWMWMDMDEINRFGLSYEEIRYVTAYFSPNQTLDSNKSLADIEAGLHKSMERMNASGLGQFLSLLALDKFDDSSKWRYLLQSLAPSGYWYYCLDLTWAKGREYGHMMRAELTFNFSQYYENAKRLSKFLKIQSTDQSIPGDHPNVTGLDSSAIYWMNPAFFNIDTDQMIRLHPGVELSISVESKVYRRLRGCRRGKDVEEDPLYYKYVCEMECEIRTNTSFGQVCIELYEETSFGAYFSGSFRDGTVDVCHRGVLVNGSLIGVETPIWKDEVNHDDRREARRRCQESCQPKCERTSTSWSIQVAPLPPGTLRAYGSTGGASLGSSHERKSQIAIDFPDRSSLIIFEQVLQYEWTDMVSDLGGLLGLWLGASMMSLFQVVHLCCSMDAKASEEMNVV